VAKGGVVPKPRSNFCFYADNSRTTSDFARIAVEVIKSINMEPVVHVNCTQDVASSSLGVELRNDFYGASIVIMYFHPAVDGWFPPEHHWCYLELKHLMHPGLIYLSPRMSESDERTLGLIVDNPGISITRIHASGDFHAAIERDLKILTV
jgi:hypothetical protein